MAGIKCLKCGANIPDAAEFCPSCGAPKAGNVAAQQQAQPTQQQPMYQQQMVKTGDPLKNLAETLFSTKFMMIFILIGILLIFIGMFIWTFGYPGEPTNDADDYGILKPAAIVTNLGFFAISTTLLCGGIVNSKLNGYVRLGLILAGAWILTGALSGMDFDPGNYLPW